jgi:hypothetical protein
MAKVERVAIVRPAQAVMSTANLLLSPFIGSYIKTIEVSAFLLELHCCRERTQLWQAPNGRHRSLILFCLLELQVKILSSRMCHDVYLQLASEPFVGNLSAKEHHDSGSAGGCGC